MSASQIDGRRRALADLGHALDHLGVADEAGVGQPERGRDAVARHVERAEAQPVGDPGRDHVVDAGGGDGAPAGQGLSSSFFPGCTRHTSLGMGIAPAQCRKPRI